jgi:hypothetical protein
MVADVEHDAVAGELAAYQREESLAKELGRVKAENAELLTKVQKVTASLKNAKVTAREALIEMADQNAKLVQAFVDKKRECKQLKVGLSMWHPSSRPPGQEWSAAAAAKQWLTTLKLAWSAGAAVQNQARKRQLYGLDRHSHTSVTLHHLDRY